MMNKPCNCAYVYNYDVNIEMVMKLWLYNFMIYNLHQYFCNLKKIFHHSEKHMFQV